MEESKFSKSADDLLASEEFWPRLSLASITDLRKSFRGKTRQVVRYWVASLAANSWLICIYGRDRVFEMNVPLDASGDS
jgi:hypothetical protein